MMSDSPALSVLMPILNSKTYLREAVDSVLGQTFQNFELIVIEESSIESTSQFWNEYQSRDPRLRVTVQPGTGAASALNHGLSLARANWIAQHDSDCVSYPARFDRQLQFLEKNSDCLLLGTGFELFGRFEPGKRRYYPVTHEQICDDLIHWNSLCHGSVVYHRDFVRDLGGYRAIPEVQHIEDYDLWVRIASRHRIANLPECLYRVRLHPEARFKIYHKLQQRNTKRFIETIRKNRTYQSFWRVPGYNPINWTFVPLVKSKRRERQFVANTATQIFRSISTFWRLGEYRASLMRLQTALRYRPREFANGMFKRTIYKWIPGIFRRGSSYLAGTVGSPFKSIRYRGLRREVWRLYLKYIRPLQGKDVNLRPAPSSDVPIDVVIPATDKDAETLPLVINSVREFVRHPLGTIHIVAPESARLRTISMERGCRFILENDVVPIRKSDIVYHVKGWDRSGWMLQQLIKLNGDKISGNEHFLVLDADTIFAKPVVFKVDEKVILNCSDECHRPYYAMIHRLLDGIRISPFSFVAHHMLMEKSKLRLLKAEVESKSGMKWHEAILKYVDRNEVSSFSEYETYGNFCSNRFPNQVHVDYWFNLSMHRIKLSPNGGFDRSLIPRMRVKCVSFHDYNDG